MYMLNAITGLMILCCASVLFAQESPGLGIPATPDQVAGWDISIGPDGENLPEGSGSVAEGAAVYTLHCSACHGPDAQGGTNDQLVGGHGTLASDSPIKTVGSYWPYATTLFDYVRRSMPFQLPGTLSNDQVYAVTAYLLQLNGVIDEDDIMNAQTLPRVEMPNRDNFVWAWSEE